MKLIKQIPRLTEALTVASSLLLLIATASNAAASSKRSHAKSFGEWTAICSYDDMLERSSCSVVSDSKRARQGLIRGELTIVESGGATSLMVLVSGATPSPRGPILKVDDNPPDGGFEFGEPTYNVNESGMTYDYLIEVPATGGKRLRVRVPLSTGDNLEVVFDLSGYPQAKALVDKREASEARP